MCFDVFPDDDADYENTQLRRTDVDMKKQIEMTHIIDTNMSKWLTRYAAFCSIVVFIFF